MLEFSFWIETSIPPTRVIGWSNTT